MITEKIDNTENLREQNERLHQQLRDYERLHRVLQTICSSLQVDEILKNIIDEAMSLCHAQQGAIMLFEPNGREVAKTLIRHGEGAGNKLDRYLNNLIAGWIAQRNEALLTNDLLATFGSENVPAKYHDIASILSVPLTWQSRDFGVINLISLTREQEFGERELRLMEILAKPCAQFIANARLHESLFAETVRLRQEVQDKYSFHGLIGHSPKMQEMFALLQKVIPTEGRVLLEGESGTGKERVARLIHYEGPRKNGPFVAVDCGALNASLLESELFGYTKGAFTGADPGGKKGLFEAADGGTLFLDEIVSMPLEIQSKFLRAIQEGEIRALGSTQVRKVDVRIIAAASRNLRAEVAANRFRHDLFFRLHVVNIPLPPLRERREDIALLANHFLLEAAAKHKKKIAGFKPETMVLLEAYAWPGNVRELEHVVERMVILAEHDSAYLGSELLLPEIQAQALAANEAPASKPSPPNLKAQHDAHERAMLVDALSKHRWNQTAAAKALGIRESNLRYKMRKYRLKKP